MCTIANFIFCCIMNKKEEWRSVVGYEGMYEVSNVGTIRSLNRIVSRSDGGIRNIKGKILKTRIDKNGYERVGLNKNGNSKLWLVHRIVGMAFLEKRSGCDYIDHIDGNRSNNLPSNLRWCTIIENNTYPIAISNRRNAANNLRVRVAQYSKDMVFIKSFSGANEARRQTGIWNGHITECCQGKRKTAGGYIWKYV